MKQFFFLLLFISFFTPAKAQQVEFAPVGTEITYYYFKPFTLEDGYVYAQSLFDTVLLGKNCKRMVVPGNWFRYIHQSNDSIFYLDQFNQQFRYLFKNRFMVGDTFQVNSSLGHSNFFVVDAVDTLMFNNEVVHKYHMHVPLDDYYNTLTIYDRYGPSRGFWSNWCGLPCDATYYDMRCFLDNIIPVQHANGLPCFEDDPLDAGVLPDTALAAIPNPTSGPFRLSGFPSAMQLQKGHWEIFNAMGKLESSGPFTSLGSALELDLSGVAPGVYSVKITAGSGAAVSRVVKI